MRSKVIEGRSYYAAWESLVEIHPALKSRKLIYLDGLDPKQDEFQYEGDNFLFCYTKSRLKAEENTNVTKSSVENYSVKGDKNWRSRYIAVFDKDDGDELVPTVDSAVKKEAVDSARIVTEMTGRDTFVILGKSPIKFSRVQARITYKASKGQELGKYLFIW